MSVKDETIFKEGESIEMLKNLGLFNNMEKNYLKRSMKET